MRSVLTGQAPPEPVSWTMRPSGSTFLRREIMEASGWRAAMLRMME